MDADTAKKAWDTLEEEFEGNEQVRSVKLHYLRREFETIKMKESETIEEYYGRIKEIVNKMKLYGKEIKEKRVVEKILITLTEKYDSIVAYSIETSSDPSSLPVNKLIGLHEAHEAHEARLNSRVNIDSIENAFQSKLKLQPRNKEDGGKKNVRECSINKNFRNFSENKKDKYSLCGICNKPGHAEKDCWHHGKPICHYCNKSGHVEKYCRNKNKHQENFAEEQESWYLDNGCNNHMAKDQSIFKDIDNSVKVKVRLGNDTMVESQGKCTVMVETKKGMRLIKDILLVPNLKENLLSIGQMMENRYFLLFERDICKIYDSKMLEVGQVKMEKRNRNFPISFKFGTNIAIKIEVDDSWLWHQRFGHFNIHALKHLHQKGMTRDLPSLKENNEACEGFLLEKQHRLSFSTSKALRAKDLLELIHTDVCGPMRTPSHTNNRYFILFINDFSRMTWVYFLKTKSEVFGIFKKFKALVEKQSGKQIKVLRSDRGKEYTSREFDKFCDDEGIERQLTIAYTPQQNGVLERLLQHIKDGTFINWMSSLHSSMAYLKKRSMWSNHQD
uniref:Retrovirus-related Pol polyprotein from transposon TNT 1-94 n=1 Tax=Cajanus cajan TaxID=3821 RepID=A0A151SGS0_CAJCA|nr:Retrovirus-related Pol polyprotein from transposon TNT 1-94 [Cajanus cajan]